MSEGLRADAADIRKAGDWSVRRHRGAAVCGRSAGSREAVNAAFDHVEIAVGGANRRNVVLPVADALARIADARRRGVADIYATYHLFERRLADYAREHGRDGHPSVSGYPGPALPRCLPFDLDDEQDPARALDDARLLVRRLHDLHDVPAEALRIAFSGCKGISVELPAVLFGGFEPATDDGARLKAAARVIAEGFATADFVIYEKLRLWRCHNTVNSKSGLHKVPLTARELLDLSLDEIRELAARPRLSVPSPALTKEGLAAGGRACRAWRKPFAHRVSPRLFTSGRGALTRRGDCLGLRCGRSVLFGNARFGVHDLSPNREVALDNAWVIVFSSRNWCH
jgi:hypothetical protein